MKRIYLFSLLCLSMVLSMATTAFAAGYTEAIAVITSGLSGFQTALLSVITAVIGIAFVILLVRIGWRYIKSWLAGRG